MKKFWIAFNKKNNSTMHQSSDKQTVIDWSTSYLKENPSKGQLVILEAVAEVRLTSSPIEVTDILSVEEAATKMEKDGKEIADAIRKLEGGTTERIAETRAVEATPPMQSLSDFLPATDLTKEVVGNDPWPKARYGF